jgi:hypothetical protein
VKILNKQSRTTEGFGFERGASGHKKSAYYKMLRRALDLEGFPGMT